MGDSKDAYPAWNKSTYFVHSYTFDTIFYMVEKCAKELQ
jgi:hypothetical protein